MTTDTDLRYDLTVYSDGRGGEHIAVTVPMPEIERVLGEPHEGGPEQDERLARLLLAAGGPEWIRDPEGGWIEPATADRPALWGVYGPKLDAGDD